MWSLFASVESPLFLVGRMVMTVPNALVALQYAYKELCPDNLTHIALIT
jgi:hypothetical protein